ncbi:hypothetical protein [Amycolatopsis endophytica]|uniref:hypothetical protein n=1 Tax=Amycolatopsis endophytica TaxID=860233 RepID=UPI0015CCB50B|nr:hypothetical protein [Amycolatopsis endophytica]
MTPRWARWRLRGLSWARELGSGALAPVARRARATTPAPCPRDDARAAARCCTRRRAALYAPVERAAARPVRHGAVLAAPCPACGTVSCLRHRVLLAALRDGGALSQATSPV